MRAYLERFKRSKCPGGGDFKIVPSKDFSIIGGCIRTIVNLMRKMMIKL